MAMIGGVAPLDGVVLVGSGLHVRYQVIPGYIHGVYLPFDHVTESSYQ